jgi:hypothetical protein
MADDASWLNQVNENIDGVQFVSGLTDQFKRKFASMPIP